jgi:hypothetical protein
VDRTESRRSAAKRRQSILELLRLGLSRGAVARQLGISKQRISTMLGARTEALAVFPLSVIAPGREIRVVYDDGWECVVPLKPDEIR